MDWVCELCIKSFSNEECLRRHTASKHSTVSFECAECGKCFGTKCNLKLHLSLHTPKDSFLFECKHCSKKFRLKRTLSKHILFLHCPSNRGVSEKKGSFECFHCGKKLSRRQNLLRHVENKHDSLQKSFECYHCSQVFQKKQLLASHIRSCHVLNQKSQSCRQKCLLCDNVFRLSKALNTHYFEAHNLMLTYENLEFGSVEQFEEWRQNMQRQTITQFNVLCRKRTLLGVVCYYICHRSGSYRGKVNEDDRKRCLKTNGYKGIGGVCPARIKLTTHSNGTCRVHFQKTHVGHNISDEAELKHIYISNAEKLQIAEKIRNGLPLSSIWKQERLSNVSTKNINRLNIISRKDIHNIAAQFNLGFKNREPVRPNEDITTTEAKIVLHEKDVLYYKRQNEEDTNFGILNKSDFVLVIMTKNQEKYLRLYGEKIIAMDGTHETNPYGFILHTLLVVDVDGEGLPAAFVLSNREDQTLIDVFLLCIRDRIGVLNCRTLISDMELTYRNSWVKIMSTPQNFLFCTWRVRLAWENNYSKIANQEKKEFVKKSVRSLADELDPIRFEIMLDSFLSTQDEDLENFLKYFRDNFLNNAHCWAYCYRKTAGINTNIHVELFHRKLKQNVASGQQIQSMTECLNFIFDYLDLLEFQIREKEIRGKVTSKLAHLRSKHRDALARYKEEGSAGLVSLDNNIFLVNSFQKSSCEMYTVTRTESKECALLKDNVSCRLFCDSCNMCFHEFSCSCMDSSIRNYMCKHIHLLGLYLKKQTSPNEHPLCIAQNQNCATEKERIATDTKHIVQNKITQNTNTPTAEFGKENTKGDQNGEKQQWQTRMFQEIQLLAVGSDDFPGATAAELEYIYKKFIVPMRPALVARRKVQLNQLST